MSNESEVVDLMPEEISIWPNLDRVPLDERCRAWCLAIVLETIPFGGKPEAFAKDAAKAAQVFEEYIHGKKGPKLEAV